MGFWEFVLGKNWAPPLELPPRRINVGAALLIIESDHNSELRLPITGYLKKIPGNIHIHAAYFPVSVKAHFSELVEKASKSGFLILPDMESAIPTGKITYLRLVNFKDHFVDDPHR